MKQCQQKGPAPLKIAIIGAGFSGASVAANLHRLTPAPIDIILFDNTGSFGSGFAYRTPFPFHLLNVRAQDMSAFEDEPAHFVHWLNSTSATHAYLDTAIPFGEQFVPRLLYGNYLKELLHQVQSSKKTTLTFDSAEVIDILHVQDQALLILNDGRQMKVDKVVLALGNAAPAHFPFSVTGVNCIANPWEYELPSTIPSHDPVLIIGTGLSMIDTVLTLHHHQHQGKIYAVSRHGLLPLPHNNNKIPYSLTSENLPKKLLTLTKHLRSLCHHQIDEKGDWRTIINALRPHVPAVWEKSSIEDKKRFIRHVLPYWNIHRHRVHHEIADVLSMLSAKQQLTIFSGRIRNIDNGNAQIVLRHTKESINLKINWLVNCMGPSLNIQATPEPLIQSLLQRGVATLDPLAIGFDLSASGALKTAAGEASSLFYTLGSLTKGVSWECTAVPEIRKQSLRLAQHLLNIN
jgi:uncharacterized NAD(P)/FAD-binding protein YdhS